MLIRKGNLYAPPYIHITLGLTPTHIQIIVPRDLTMNQLIRSLSDIYRSDDSEETTPEFVLVDGRILSDKKHLVQIVYEYDLRSSDILQPRIYRELLDNKSSSRSSVTIGFSSIVDRLPGDEFSNTLTDKTRDQGKFL